MIRFLVIGIPAALAALILASFVNVSLLTQAKKNEMSIGSIGEPATLNPIREADAAGGDVQAFLFNGLLKYNENLEVTTDLAKSFTLSQKTTIFFIDEKSALAALGRLLYTKNRWAEWKLVSAETDGKALILNLSEPGMQASRDIFNLLDPKAVVPLTNIRFERPDARKALASLRRELLPAPILREWFESAEAGELTFAGDPAVAAKALEEAFRAQGGETKVSVGETVSFLAEPIVDFVLRDDVRWHDGEPFTSRDVAFTYEAIMDDAFVSPRKPDFIYILRVETPDPYVVRVVYRKPYSPALTNWMMSMLPAHILQGRNLEWWASNFNRSPIGTGPYKFDTWKTNEYVRIVRNPDYFQKPGPWLDSVVFRVLPDQLSLRLAFETHQIDDWGVDPWAVSTFQHDKQYDVFAAPGRSYSYIGWNLRRPMFQDERVRQALAHAVNVPEMVQYILYGNGTQSTGIFPPQMWFFNPDVKPFAYDPEKARQLLAEAGWVKGPDGILTKDGQRFSFKIITNNANEIRRDIATLVQDDLGKIGIEVKVEMYEWAVFLKNFINKADFDAMVLGWQLGPDYDQYQIWHSSQTNPEQLNVVGYQNAEVDKLLVDIRQEYNRDKIISLAGEMQELIYRQQPYLFLYVPKSTAVIWKDSFRIRRPDGQGGWIDSPVELTKGGWDYYREWFYRPEYANLLPK